MGRILIKISIKMETTHTKRARRRTQEKSEHSNKEQHKDNEKKKRKPNTKMEVLKSMKTNTEIRENKGGKAESLWGSKNNKGEGKLLGLPIVAQP
uniref:Uncharacterized protein n=1 Tax=Catagonus wagneri TaxID=51154 RepID=A0A8C3WZT4_9CETA